MAQDYYQILGIGPESTHEEIKRGYARSVRAHTPEKDPEGFKQVDTAYQTLRDPNTRAEYDTMQRHGGEVERLMAQASECFEKENWSGAIRLLKQVVVLVKQLETPKNQLGLAFLNNNEFDESISIFRQLIESSPTTPLYWRNLGHAYHAKAASYETGTRMQGEAIADAIESFEKAHELESNNLKDFIDIANCHLTRNSYSLAIACAERAVGSSIDESSFNALIFIARVHIYEGDSGKLDAVARRICTLLPDESDVKQYVAERLANFAQEICENARKYKNEDLYAPAAIILRYAQKLDPNNNDLGNYHKTISSIADALEEYSRFKDNNSIDNGFHRLGHYYLAEAIEIEIADKDETFKDIIREIESLSVKTIQDNISNIKRQYPGIYWLGEDLFKHIESNLVNNNDTLAPPQSVEQNATQHVVERSHDSSSSNPGCIMALVVMAVIAFFIVVLNSGSNKRDIAPAPAPVAESNYTPRPVEVQKPVQINTFEYSAMTAHDKETDLTWAINADIADKPLSYAVVNDLFQELNTSKYGGYSDWRLPTKAELITITKYGANNAPYDFFNSHGFINVKADFYWTADVIESDKYKAWTINLNSGEEAKGYGKCFVWPVRGNLASEAKSNFIKEKPSALRQEDNSEKISEEAATTNISRNEVAKFIQQYLELSDSHNLDGILTLYADKVNYFTWGTVIKKEVRKDKANHYKRWQQIRSDFDGNFAIKDVPGSPDKKSVSFRFTFYVNNDKKAVKGVADSIFILQRSDGSLKIIDEKQNILSRDVQTH